MVGSAEEFWWDTLERLVLDSGPLPAMLAVADDVQTRHVPVPVEARAPLGAGGAHARWRAMRGAEPTPRHQLYVDMWRRLQPLTAGARARAIRGLAEQVGGHREPRGGYLPCTADELRTLARSPVGSVGAHTVSHPELAQLSASDQASEIRDSRAALEALLGCPVTLFSYPFGHAHSFTSQTRKLVREAGYQAACANWTGLVAEGADPLRLPRVYVGDWDGTELCRHLQQMLGEA
jgi:hypothetical protein